jgi:hypothetical protein
MATKNEYQLLDDFIRNGYLAQDPKTSKRILKQLGQNSMSTIRILVANNPNTPLETLEKLSKDSHDKVREAANNNPKIIEILLT